MNSNSTGSNISLKPHSESFNLKNIFLEQIAFKTKNAKSIHINNRLYEHQRKKGDFNYLQKYVHKHFINLYKNSKNDYNMRMIEDILNNESTHLVAEFKDYLIMGDITEFLQKSYTIKESKKYFRIDFNTTNEKTGSLLSYLDEPLYDFFIQLKFKGLLENTAVFFLSEIV